MLAAVSTLDEQDDLTKISAATGVSGETPVQAGG
jgi:hypothetical protein